VKLKKTTWQLGAWVLAACAPAAAFAQAAYPSKPILVICPLQAASPSDIAVRVAVERMGASMGAVFVVENQPGAAGLIGTERAAKAAPDGYTLAGLNNSIMTMLPNIHARVPYDPFKSFEPIVMIASIPTALVVHSSVPANTVAELTALAKANPGKLNYSSGGNGSPQHLAMEMYKYMAGVNLTHVPYKGATQAALDLVSGQVQAAFISLTLTLPHARAGKVRLVAFAGDRRTAMAPDLPTMQESGVAGYNYASWTALYAPAGTPKEIVARLSAEAMKALATPELKEQFLKQGIEVWAGSPQELLQVTRDDYARMASVIKAAGIKAD
jgi:tripartite-type tricarboxylate transporter receptor subunit TctC